MRRILDKSIEYGVYLLIFSLPWQTRWIIRAGEYQGGYVEYWTYSLYGFDILLFILIGLQFFKMLAAKPAEAIKAPLLWLLLGIFELLAFVSVLSAADKPLAVFAYLRLLLAIGFFWLIVSARFSRRKALISLAGAGCLQALIGFWQFVLQASPANKWLGLARHDPAELGVAVIEAIGPDGSWERWLRAYGSLDHPNLLGGFLAFALLILIYLRIKYKNTGLFFAWGLPLTTAGLVFSFSRAAWLGLGLGLFFMALSAIRRRKMFEQKAVAEAVLAIALVFFFAYLVYPGLFDVRVSAGTRLEKISKEERLSQIESYQQLNTANSLAGTGIGNYTKALAGLDNNKKSYELQPVHNVLLLVKGEVGGLGILAFLMIMIYYFKIILKAKENIVLLGGLVLTVSIIMFDHWLWSLHFGLMLAAFLGGISLKIIYKKS